MMIVSTRRKRRRPKQQAARYSAAAADTAKKHMPRQPCPLMAKQKKHPKQAHDAITKIYIALFNVFFIIHYGLCYVNLPGCRQT